MRFREKLLIAVDGGGTGCRAAIARADGTILSQADGGPANATTDTSQAIASVLAAIHSATQLAGLDEADVLQATGHIGLAGITSTAKAQAVAGAMPFAATVTDDRPAAIAGALAGQAGYLAALGTGTIIARSDGEKSEYIGGYGLHLSDQASGGWLGRGLLQQVLLCHDGLEASSALTRSVFADLGSEAEALIAFAGSATPADYARFAPSVFTAAASGDATALKLIGQGVAYLEKALKRLGFRPGDRLCLTGGAGPHYAAFLSEGFQASLVAPAGSALSGAVLLAMRATGRTTQGGS